MSFASRAVGSVGAAYDIAVAHENSPFISVYPWDFGFGTKYADPATLPSVTGRGVAFSPDGAAVAVVGPTYYGLKAYPWSTSGFGSAYADPASYPLVELLNGVTFSSNGAYIALAGVVAATSIEFGIIVYNWSASGFGSKLSRPNQYTTVTATSVAFSPDNATIVGSFVNYPRIAAYPWNPGFGTRYAFPTSMPSTNAATQVTFSPDGANVALSYEISPYISIYPWSAAGFGTKYADPATAVPGSGQSVTFSPDGGSILVGHNTSPFVSAYVWSPSGFGTKYANPSSLPPSGVLSVKFSPDGANVAMAHAGSPYVSVYSWDGGFGVKYADPSVLPTGAANGVAWRA